MYRGSNIGWNDTGANFSDANSAMSNANTSISQTGTVFDKLRQSILDEQQKAVDNKYRAQLFDENVKQFGMQHALAQDELSEKILSNRNTEGLTARGQDIQSRGQDLSYKAAMASVGSQNVRNKLMLQQWEDAKRKEAINIKAYQMGIEKRTSAEDKLKDIKLIENIPEEYRTPQQQALLSSTPELREAVTANGLDREIAMQAAKEGDPTLLANVIGRAAATEQAMAVTSTEQKIKQQKALEESQLKASKMLDDLNLVESDKKNANYVITELVSKLGVSPEVAASIVTSYYPTTGAWTSFGTADQQKFDTPLTEIGDVLSNFDINNPNDPIVLKAIPFVKDKKNIPTEETKTSTPSLSPSELGNKVDLSSLSDSALAYREKQLVSSLPKPDEVTASSPDMQAIYKQLYRQTQGDRDINSVPRQELEDLKEKAKKQAIALRQKAIENQTRQIDRERQRRTQSKHTDLTGLTTYMWE